MVGFKAAQAVAFALRQPFLGIHHHEAHLYSPWITGPAARRRLRRASSPTSRSSSAAATRCWSMSRAELDHRLLGSTLDDAAGECFDKTGKLMGLPYPAGPDIDRLAEDGNPRAFDFPRPMLNDPNDDFSFSGLKTSVRYFLRDHPDLLDDAQRLRDLCASVQAAIVEVLVTKTIRAARRLRRALRHGLRRRDLQPRPARELAAACERERLTLRLAERPSAPTTPP